MIETMDAQEKRLRIELAACYRIFAMLGWTELIYNHITVRIPGNVIDGSEAVVNPAGFTVHAAIHAAVDSAHCVMHTHTTSGMAVASSAAGLCPNNFYSAMLTGQVAYHDFEGITVHDDEGPRLIKAMGDCPLLVLRNHGLLAWGRTIPQAFAYLWTIQRACDIQVAGAGLGATIPITEAVKLKSQKDALQFKNKSGATAAMGAGEDVFAAMVRLVDKIDVSYKL
jgi:ribulose-5-phosphate 4-epimerase/fuculose-1-phosphate aldolase